MVLSVLKQLLRYFILCMCFYFISADARADIKEMKLTLYQDKGEFKCWAQPLYLEVGDWYRIFVKSKSYLHNVIRCPHSMFIYYVLFEDAGRNGYVTGPGNVTEPGDRYIECLFYTKKCEKIIETSGRCRYDGAYEDPGVKCPIKIVVHKKGETFVPPNGFLTINGAYVTSDDGQYIHKFYEEEGATFRCHKTEGSKVKLVYTSTALKELSTDFQQTDSVSMYMRLNKKNDDATMLCVFSDEMEKYQHVIGIRLKKHKDRRGQLHFVINDLLLPLIKKIQEHKYILYNYEYNFYDGENVKISIAKDDAMYGGVKCLANGIQQLLYYFRGEYKAIDSFKFTVTENDNGTTVFCYVTSTKKETFQINLMFLIQKPDYSRVIAGIPKSNILLQYTNNTSNIIKCEITGNEILRSICTYNKDQLTSTKYYNITIKTLIEYTLKPRTYQPSPGQNNAVIKCVVNSSITEKTTHLELYRKEREENKVTLDIFTIVVSPSRQQERSRTSTESISTTIPNLSTSMTVTSAAPIPTDNEIKVSTAPAGKSENNTGIESNKNVVLIISGGVVVVVLVFAFILWVAIKKRNNMLRNKSSTMDYQNLPEHHEGPMATPAQWNRPDDATYTDPNSLDHLYSKPIPKSQRKKPEPTYANQNVSKAKFLNNQQVNDEPTYASVQDDEPTYASVQNNELAYASLQNNEPAYASVQNNEPAYASVQNNEPAYAPVQNNEPAYASVQNNELTYASIENNERNQEEYASQNSLDYQNISTLKKEAKHSKDAKKLPKNYNGGAPDKDFKIQRQEKEQSEVFADIRTELSRNNQ